MKTFVLVFHQLSEYIDASCPHLFVHNKIFFAKERPSSAHAFSVVANFCAWARVGIIAIVTSMT